MENLSEERPVIEQEDISKKIEEMLSLLKERNQLITSYYKTFVLPHHPVSKATQTRKEEKYPQ